MLTFLANAWPGWVTSSATMVTFIFDGGNAKLLAVLGLAAIAIALTMAPVVYTMVWGRYLPWIGSGLFLTFAAIWATSVADYVTAR